MNAAPLARALVMVMTMVAMMLPSFIPTLWRYYRALRVRRVQAARRETALFMLGYIGVWTALSLALVAVSGGLSFTSMADMAPHSSGMRSRWITAAFVLGAGALQCSAWKATQLRHCREQFANSCDVVSRGLTGAWMNGYRFGGRCVFSCAPITAALLAVGMMNWYAMAIATLAILAERVASKGVVIARFTGGAIVVAGAVVLVSATAAARPAPQRVCNECLLSAYQTNGKSALVWERYAGYSRGKC